MNKLYCVLKCKFQKVCWHFHWSVNFIFTYSFNFWHFKTICEFLFVFFYVSVYFNFVWITCPRLAGLYWSEAQFRSPDCPWECFSRALIAWRSKEVKSQTFLRNHLYVMIKTNIQTEFLQKYYHMKSLYLTPGNMRSYKINYFIGILSCSSVYQESMRGSIFKMKIR